MAQFEVLRVPILRFGLVNAHLIIGQNGCILVDTGTPGSEKRIEKALASRELRFSDIKLIVITHAHVDHAGSASAIRKLSGAPIVAHEGDLKHLTREEPMTFCSTGWIGQLLLRTRFILRPYVGFTPDILLRRNEMLDLEAYGFQGVVRPTPGHTAGAVSVELKGEEALVGDLLASGVLVGGLMFTNRPKRPPFEDDPKMVADQLQRMADQGVKKFYLGHGGPVNAQTVHKHIRFLKSLG